jgi:predicted RNase H-like nuclease (RuvC/YqgF family)
MEQYNIDSDSKDPRVTSVNVSDESRHIRSVESQIKKLEETISMQYHEIAKLRRDISRLKGEISDIITVLKNRG